MKRCTFSFPGTYGHECGAPAKWAALRDSEYTADGRYWSARCDRCRDHKGGENAGLANWEPYDAARHVNRWTRNRWPQPADIVTVPA